ncbi:MAG: hypothetical protein QGH25_14190 [Candidatus Latescibacteria bacterium]|jgi:predicted MFS family arabinose efflux permease|nr:hypothetical protein [Candidatus Latescibacterota bacterium]
MDGTAAPPGASALSSPAFRKYLCGNITLQSRTPEPIRGRVMSANTVAFNLSTFSGIWTGAAITLVGDERLGMAVGPLIMLCIILLALATQRRIRTLAEV